MVTELHVLHAGPLGPKGRRLAPELGLGMLGSMCHAVGRGRRRSRGGGSWHGGTVCRVEAEMAEIVRVR